MAVREKKGIIRQDMIQALMKARKDILHSEVVNETNKETGSYAAESHANKLQSHKRGNQLVELTSHYIYMLSLERQLLQLG